VIEALKERDTIQQIAQKYEVHPNQISAWKQEFLKNAGAVFEETKSNGLQDQEKENLLARIGQLLVENDFLKKSLS
jgi:transposase